MATIEDRRKNPPAKSYTTSLFAGGVSKIGESYLHVEVANGVELQVQRTAIVQVLPKGTFK